MFFLLLSFSLLLAVTGGFFLSAGNPTVGWLMIGGGVLSLFITFVFYSIRGKRRRGSRRLDCDGVDCGFTDCDCSPDCDCGGPNCD